MPGKYEIKRAKNGGYYFNQSDLARYVVLSIGR